MLKGTCCNVRDDWEHELARGVVRRMAVFSGMSVDELSVSYVDDE